ncbi:MAG: hypothetical protein HY335_07240, partial [Deinococcus sp.]|nr:hypothetical protein [Deinococcus sp.]
PGLEVEATISDAAAGDPAHPQVQVSGPSEVIRQMRYVVADVDLSALQSSGLISARLLPDPVVRASSEVHIDPTELTVSVSLQKTKLLPVEVRWSDYQPLVLQNADTQAAVVFKGPPETIDRLANQRLTATLSLSGQGPGNVSRVLRLDDLALPQALREGLQLLDPLPVRVLLAALQSKSLPVTIATIGQPAQGQVRLDFAQDLVTVSGPATLVGRVTQVTGTVSMVNSTQSFNATVLLEARDDQQQLVEGVTLSVPSRQVRIELLVERTLTPALLLGGLAPNLVLLNPQTGLPLPASPGTAPVRVRGPLALLDQASSTALVDLSQAQPRPAPQSFAVAVTLSSRLELVETPPPLVVIVERLVQKELPVAPVLLVDGIVPVFLENVQAAQQTVAVSGPQRSVDQVSRVLAPVATLGQTVTSVLLPVRADYTQVAGVSVNPAQLEVDTAEGRAWKQVTLRVRPIVRSRRGEAETANEQANPSTITAYVPIDFTGEEIILTLPLDALAEFQRIYGPQAPLTELAAQGLRIEVPNVLLDNQSANIVLPAGQDRVTVSFDIAPGANRSERQSGITNRGREQPRSGDGVQSGTETPGGTRRPRNR